MVILAAVFLAPMSALAQGEIEAHVGSLVAQARRFQEPYAAIHHWGDPWHIDGVASPQIQFRHQITAYAAVFLNLVYSPAAQAPIRLRFIDVTTQPALSEKQIVAWLGKPAAVKADKYGVRQLEYEGGDTAGLRVLYVWVDGGRPTIRFAPRR